MSQKRLRVCVGRTVSSVATTRDSLTRSTIRSYNGSATSATSRLPTLPACDSYHSDTNPRKGPGLNRIRIDDSYFFRSQPEGIGAWPVSKGSRINVNFCEFLERAMGIEPTSEAWEASILPLYDARSVLILLQLGCYGTAFPFSIVFQNINFMAKLQSECTANRLRRQRTCVVVRHIRLSDDEWPICDEPQPEQGPPIVIECCSHNATHGIQPA
jgi:hypothetical protein